MGNPNTTHQCGLSVQGRLSLRYIDIADSQLVCRQAREGVFGCVHKYRARVIVLEPAESRPELGVSVPAMTARLSQDVTIAVAIS